MKQQYIIILALLLPVLMFAAVPVVSNVQVSQRDDGSMLVDITYDVTDADGDDLDISLECSSDGGTTWDYAITAVTGDVGSGIAPGTGKAIVWDFPGEHPDEYDTDYIVRVTAEDGIPSVPAGFVYVPAGSFLMGEVNEAAPIHTVNLDAFFIGTYEVTHQEVIDVYNWAHDQGYVFGTTSTVENLQGDRQQLLDLDHYSNHCAIIWDGNHLEYNDFNSGIVSSPDCPVIFITWYGAVAYCNFLSLQEGLNPCYDFTDWSCDFTANGYRLPTEAEWEYAARGATDIPDYQYAGSDDIYAVAWFMNNNSPAGTKVGGLLQPNGIGTYDQSGNVREWCWDWYGSYSYGEQTNPTGPASGSSRVLRGGNFHSAATAARVHFRQSEAPSHAYTSGLRLCRNAE